MKVVRVNAVYADVMHPACTKVCEQLTQDGSIVLVRTGTEFLGKVSHQYHVAFRASLTPKTNAGTSLQRALASKYDMWDRRAKHTQLTIFDSATVKPNLKEFTEMSQVIARMYGVIPEDHIVPVKG